MAALKAVTCALPLIIVMLCVYFISNMNFFDTMGLKGSKGDKGIKGDTGAKGKQGDKGLQGDKGMKGTTGEKGVEGEKGQKGDKGNQGDKGDEGAPGHIGPQGDKGEKGNKGEKGESGVDIHPFMIIHGQNKDQLRCMDNKPPQMRGFSQFVRKQRDGTNMEVPAPLKGAFSCVETKTYEDVKKDCDGKGCTYVNYWLGTKGNPFKCIKCDTTTYDVKPKYGEVDKELKCEHCYEPLWANYGYKFVNYKFEGKKLDTPFEVCLEESDPKVYCTQGKICKDLDLIRDESYRCQVCVQKNNCE